MYIDLEHVRSKGLDQESLKKIFEASEEEREKTESGKKVNKLIELHRWRIDEGVRRSLAEARVVRAIDRAFDASQNQITYTIVRDLIDRGPGQKELLSMAKDWGLESMLVDMVDSTGNRLDDMGRKMKNNSGNPGKKLNLPTFFNIFMPMVAAYVKIRWAKLFNDRDVYPLLKYEPHRQDEADRALCKVVTARIDRFSVDLGYREDIKQSIKDMLLYSRCLVFPRESYYREEQMVKGSKKVVKEGIRWYRPHPTRCFFDQAHPLHTINSDSGCEYAGFWSIKRWQEVDSSPHYWNKDKVGFKDLSWRNSSLWTYYQELYPCAARFPDIRTGGSNEREQEAFFYRRGAKNDDGVDVVDFHHKLVPKDWGLGDYEYPIWMRFVYAGDRSVIFAEPMGYAPVHAYLYEYDENRTVNSSLAQELLPFQDHISNLLSQYLMTVKKNLVRVVGVDTDMVTEEFFKTVENSSENMLRGIEFAKFSGKHLARQQSDFSRAFVPVPMPIQPTGELIGAINTIIGMAERVLGFSAQELGQSADHQQSATETSITATNTTARMGFTASGIDPAIYAMKKALYNALLAHGSDEITVQVADLTEGGMAALKRAGFEVESGEEAGYGVVGKKEALSVEQFSSEREGANRISDPQAAQLMLTFVDRMMVPQIAQLVGLDNILKMFNQVASRMGVPGDFKAMMAGPKPPSPEEQQAAQQASQEQAVQQIQAVVQSQLEPLVGGIQQQLGEPVAAHDQKITALEQAITQIAQKAQTSDEAMGMLMEQLNRLVETLVPQPPAPPQ